MNRKMNNLMICVSGGRSSARMARHIQTSKKYKNLNKVYIFCNTGMERPETIDFLKNMERNWGIELIKIEGVYSEIMGVGVNYKIVNWDNLSMNAAPFAGAIMQKNKGKFSGLPNEGAPYCSEMLKTLPAQKFCDDFFGKNNYLKSLGFRKEDMPKRISYAEIKHDKTRIFPLITDFQFPIGQNELNSWWTKQSFKLEIHNRYGNCELCWKKSIKNLIENIRYGSNHIEWYRRQEEIYGGTSFRNKLSIDDLVKMAKQPSTLQIPFNEFQDDKCVCSF